MGELGRVLRREVERVEAQVARRVARAQRGLGLELLAVKLAERHVDAVRLRRRDARTHHDPEPHGQLRDLVDGGAAVRREERVELLLHEEAQRREHAHAAVRDLALAVPVHLQLRLALEEARRVPVEIAAAERVEVARRPYANAGFAGVAFLPKPPNCICGDTLEAPTAEPAKAVVWIEAMESMIVLVV